MSFQFPLAPALLRGTLALSALTTISPALAQEEEKNIPVIVISATRSPTDLRQIASSVTVITRKDIEEKNKPQVTDLLRSVPGINIAANGSGGQTAKVFMRGTNSNHVLVLLDGVAINDPSDPNDAFDFSNLSTDNIERIEVLRGAQSTLYGSQAIGGVINIISREGKGAPKQTAFAEYGRYNSSKLGVGSSGSVKDFSYSLQAGNYHTNGVSAMAPRFGGVEQDGSNIYTFSGNFANRFTDQFTGKLNLRYNRNRTQFDTPSQFSSRPHDDAYPENDTRQINGRVAGEYSALDGNWTQELGVSYLTLGRSQITEFSDSSFVKYFNHQQYVSWREKADWLHHLKLIPNHVFTLGAESWTDHYKLNAIPRVALGEKNAYNRALFADDQFTYDDFFVNTGIRVDRHETFGRHSTWKVAPGYNITTTGTKLKSSYGTSFKAPSLFSLYDLTYGNPNLKPETSKGYDVGFEQLLFANKVTIGATLFRNNITGMFDTRKVADPDVYKYVNVGKARTQGVETMFEFRPTVDWKLLANYTFTQADDRTASLRFKRRPKHMLNASAQWQYSEAGDIGLTARYVSVRTDYNFAFGDVYTPSFTTFDANTNYRVSENVTLYGRGENLLNRRYEEVYGYAMPGASLIGGVKASF